jgi:hypothetical protein
MHIDPTEVFHDWENISPRAKIAQVLHYLLNNIEDLSRHEIHETATDYLNCWLEYHTGEVDSE